MGSDLKQNIIAIIQEIVDREVTDKESIRVTLDVAKEKQFGDWSVNAAMRLTKKLRRPPLEIAKLIVEKLTLELQEQGLADKIKRIDIKPPGFINLFLANEALYDVLDMIQEQKGSFGKSNKKTKEKILIEFVSANPTGPLSIAHARQAAVGDSLANILEFCGNTVSREYYINDEGNQINNLGLSLRARYNEKLGVKDVEFPEQGYKGEYLHELANGLIAVDGNKFRNDESQKALKKFADFAAGSILKGIDTELSAFGVEFDDWFSQKEHITHDKVKSVLKELELKEFIYEADGATWFRSTQFGDDKDRVVIKSDGQFTYLAPDIAYHKIKFERGFNKLIDILGPDHHGYINRIKAATCALGYEKDDLSVLIIQLATLSRDGKPVRMSTRAGEYITLKELIDEVGRDAARFFFLMRKCDSQLDFDLELAKKHSMDNPVYYVQYAHARICGIFETLGEYTSELKDIKINYAHIAEVECLDLIRKMNSFSTVLTMSARNLDPQGLTTYLRELASEFHSFYNKHRVLDEKNLELTKARSVLIDCARVVIRNGLDLLGVSAPAKM